jgi:release factor glutamine methyltransferase
VADVVFCGLSLAIAPGQVMTPRPVSEQLVSKAVAITGKRPATVVDVGTGSGAVAIAIATEAPSARVWATDINPRAVLLARANVSRYGLSERVRVFRGDLLDPVPGRIDLVVANLPYLPLSERGLYPDLVSEPTDALFAAGDGLEHYRRLVVQCRRRLDAEGSLIIQLRGSVFVAARAELGRLSATLADYARFEHQPREAAASG